MNPIRRLTRPTLTAALLLLWGCGGLGGMVATEIEVEGGQRTVEEQVLGSFEHIGEEVYLLAGVRAIDPMTGAPSPPRPMTASEARALTARRRMEFNRDDILRFQREGYVGEGNLGLPAAFAERVDDLAESDPRRARLVLEVVEEESEDRLTVMQRIVDTMPELKGRDGLLAVRQILAARYRDEAEPGTQVQLADGTWMTK